ncbi:bestrophin family protein [Chitinophaga sp. Ak27]|uniref:bestrophin family protein n=1 Tax=Chitinophaga sp. Ak27 TaxID=2726116 RepID=UPI00145FB2A3|nr:bestrophin family ion channel [Chitinophaga sp. Ak27]NLU91863.1 multidrug transporter [Chitinophaga sp. Ak27]
MYTGKSYKISEFLFWTRRNILWLLLMGTIPTILYQVFGFKWLSVPWPIVAFLGTAAAFVVGFKNQQTYNRTWEARETWGTTISASRTWAMMCRDFITDTDIAQQMIYRHLAWLTALRYQLRTTRNWESTGKSYNREYARFYSIPEKEIPIRTELAKYISTGELDTILSQHHPAMQLLNHQSNALTKLANEGRLDNSRFFELHKSLREFSALQGKSEKIKNFPYPRQYATVNRIFVWLFCLLLPFAMLKEFNELNNVASGMFKGQMVWLVIPFSVLISWVYTSLEQVGESTENPFEGNANDIPISQMSRSLERDIFEMLGKPDLPPAFDFRNNIVL